MLVNSVLINALLALYSVAAFPSPDTKRAGTVTRGDDGYGVDYEDGYTVEKLKALDDDLDDDINPKLKVRDDDLDDDINPRLKVRDDDDLDDDINPKLRVRDDDLDDDINPKLRFRGDDRYDEDEDGDHDYKDRVNKLKARTSHCGAGGAYYCRG
ncbi:hypothetical protein ACHAPT_012810 [Fusarium lateritium]